MNRILIIASSLVFAISMASLSTKPSHSPAWPSGEQIAHGIMAIAVMVMALVLILVSLFAVLEPKSRNTGLICIALCLPLPISTLCREMSRSNRMAELIKWRDWGIQAMEITPLLIEYQNLYPDRFRYVSNDSEEVSIFGFPEFALTRNKKMSSRAANGTIELLDPWNEPICFVMSRGDDEEIVCRGLRQRIIFGGGEDERPWDNPKGLGVSRSKPTEVIVDGRFREAIVVYKSVRFSKRDIEDRKQMKKHQEEREAKAASSSGPA
ncbi:MAG: hypothetical protein ACOYMN_07710 [Roseimicrobium sp.]